MDILIDTNVLLRRVQLDHEQHAIAIGSVARILDGGDEGCITPQICAEFWNVATRPAGNNGLGFPVETALRELEKIERALRLLSDKPEIYEEWKRLVITHRVLGSKVHDARLVAAMNVHGIRRILTFNTSDFARFSLDILDPASLV